jgi:hypothetical protein
MTKTAADNHWIVIWEIRLVGQRRRWSCLVQAAAMRQAAVADIVGTVSSLA